VGGIRSHPRNVYDWSVPAFYLYLYLSRLSSFCIRSAWGALSESIKLTQNDTLLIRGGTTSVGLAMATLAKTIFSCPRVIATTRSPKKVATLKAAGVDDIILDSGKVSEDVLKITDGKGVDKCAELVGATTLADSCASLGPDGTLSFIGIVGGEWVVKDFYAMDYLYPRKVSRCVLSSVQPADASTIATDNILVRHP
jgi:NADPH:quinone reductase-like Zn-dependent oxidoreductase